MESYLSEQLTDAVEDDFTDRDVSEWWFEASSLGLGDADAVPKRPYIVWNEGEDFEFAEVKETSNARRRRFRIYVYDEPGDFTRINRIMRNMKARVKTMAPFVIAAHDDEPEIRCSESVWGGMSGQIPQDGAGSCCKFGTALFTVSE